MRFRRGSVLNGDVKRIGIIGGMSWEFTVTYYQLMNREVQRRLGGYHSADIVWRSVDFAPIEELQRAGAWQDAGTELAAVARECVAAGAARRLGVSILGLLGTSFTMELPFYRERLEASGGLSVIVPEAEDRQQVHDIIFDELVVGTIRPESREIYRRVMGRLAKAGAEGIILGCTEIGLLVGSEDAPSTEGNPVPVLDTTELHALAAVEAALA